VEKAVTNPYRAFRQLERMLFLGVPERPEPFWEREGNGEMEGRLTGRSQLGDHLLPILLQGAQTISTITYRPESGEILHESAPLLQPSHIGPRRDDRSPGKRLRAQKAKK
jgi:hypothetical protein